jgi:hypothetical protein
MNAPNRSSAVPPAPAAERNVWNNIPSAEDVNLERSRGRQIVAVTSLLVVLGVVAALAVLFSDELAGLADLLRR